MFTHIFTVSSAPYPLYKPSFPSGTTSLLSQCLPSFTFLTVHESPAMNAFSCCMSEMCTLTLIFGKHFHQIENSSLIVLYFQYFRDFALLFSG